MRRAAELAKLPRLLVFQRWPVTAEQGALALRFSTQAQAEPSSSGEPSLKAQLRELYKRVHPDLFHSHPPAREANERSFKLLQEYLSIAQRGRDHGHGALPYRFEFYLKSEVAAAEASEADLQSESLSSSGASSSRAAGDLDSEPAAAAEELRRVALVLPPPARREPGHGVELPRSTQRALGQLLQACGLGYQLAGRLAEDGMARARLREFIPEAAELARKRQTGQYGPRHRLALLLSALRVGRQVHVGFGDEARIGGAVLQAELLQRVGRALDAAAGLDVAGLHLMLGAGYGVDPSGHIWLDHLAHHLAWAKYLMHADLAYSRQRRALAGRVKLLEAAVAQQLGLGMVYTSEDLQLQPQYMEFLTRLAAEGSSRGPIAAVSLLEVPLRVLAGEPSLEQHRAWRVDSSMGFVAVPVDSRAHEVYNFLTAQGPAALAILHRNADEARRLEALRSRVERALRLRRFLRDGSVSTAEFEAAAGRLLANARQLWPLTEGLSLRVSHVNQVAPDGAHVDIAWDFEL